MNAYPYHDNLEADLHPFKPSDKTPAPSNIIIAALWETLKQKTQLNHVHFLDLQKMWDNKRVLFWASQCVLICYTALDNWDIPWTVFGTTLFSGEFLLWIWCLEYMATEIRLSFFLLVLSQGKKENPG